MNFEEKIKEIKSPPDMAEFINALLEDSLIEDEPSFLAPALEKMAACGIAPAPKTANGKFYAHLLPWGGTKSHLEAAKVIFRAFGVPKDENGSFLETLWERAREEKSDYALSLYLIAAANSHEHNHLMSVSRRFYDWSRTEDFIFEREQHKCECCNTQRESVHIIHRESGAEAAVIEW